MGEEAAVVRVIEVTQGSGQDHGVLNACPLRLPGSVGWLEEPQGKGGMA